MDTLHHQIEASLGRSHDLMMEDRYRRLQYDHIRGFPNPRFQDSESSGRGRPKTQNSIFPGRTPQNRSLENSEMSPYFQYYRNKYGSISAMSTGALYGHLRGTPHDSLYPLEHGRNVSVRSLGSKSRSAVYPWESYGNMQDSVYNDDSLRKRTSFQHHSNSLPTPTTCMCKKSGRSSSRSLPSCCSCYTDFGSSSKSKIGVSSSPRRKSVLPDKVDLYVVKEERGNGLDHKDRRNLKSSQNGLHLPKNPKTQKSRASSKKKQDASLDPNQPKSVQSLDRKELFSSISSRKSILECDVTAYDLIKKYIKTTSVSEIDSDLDDDLSDNAIEEDKEKNLPKSKETCLKKSASFPSKQCIGLKGTENNPGIHSTECEIESSNLRVGGGGENDKGKNPEASNLRLGGQGLRLYSPPLSGSSILSLASETSRNNPSLVSSGWTSPSASDNRFVSVPEPDYDDNEAESDASYETCRFKDLKLSSSPLLVRKNHSSGHGEPQNSNYSYLSPFLSNSLSSGSSSSQVFSRRHSYDQSTSSIKDSFGFQTSVASGTEARSPDALLLYENSPSGCDPIRVPSPPSPFGYVSHSEGSLETVCVPEVRSILKKSEINSTNHGIIVSPVHIHGVQELKNSREKKQVKFKAHDDESLFLEFIEDKESGLTGYCVRSETQVDTLNEDLRDVLSIGDAASADDRKISNNKSDNAHSHQYSMNNRSSPLLNERVLCLTPDSNNQLSLSEEEEHESPSDSGQWSDSSCPQAVAYSPLLTEFQELDPGETRDKPSGAKESLPFPKTILLSPVANYDCTVDQENSVDEFLHSPQNWANGPSVSPKDVPLDGATPPSRELEESQVTQSISNSVNKFSETSLVLGSCNQNSSFQNSDDYAHKHALSKVISDTETDVKAIEETNRHVKKRYHLRLEGHPGSATSHDSPSARIIERFDNFDSCSSASSTDSLPGTPDEATFEPCYTFKTPSGRTEKIMAYSRPLFYTLIEGDDEESESSVGSSFIDEKNPLAANDIVIHVPNSLLPSTSQEKQVSVISFQDLPEVEIAGETVKELKLYDEGMMKQGEEDGENIYECIKAEPIYEELPEKLELNIGLHPLDSPRKSFFEGASKAEILSYLEVAKERGLENFIEEPTELLDEDEVVEPEDKPEPDKTCSRNNRNRISNLSSSSQSSSNSEQNNTSTLPPSQNPESVQTIKERPLTAEVERNDSGVGTETSKPNRLRQIDKTNGGEEQQCADCEQLVKPREDGSTGLLYCPLVCKRCDKKRCERKETILEFIDTEVKYGRDLRIVKEEFYRPMEIAGLLTREQLSGIFLNLDELIILNSKFSEKLQDALDIAAEQGDEDFTTVNIGKLFIESTTMLHAFETYCVHQGSASLVLQNLEKEKELLQIFLRVSQMENTLLRRMDLASFLMVPVQRVTKYPLLLNRLYKVTPHHHQDRGTLKEAQLKVNLHLEHINQQTKGVGGTKIWRRISNISNSNRQISNDIGIIKLRKMALEVLQWNRDEVRFVMAGKLYYTQITDHAWNKKNKLLKFTYIHALLVTLGKPNTTYRPDLANEKSILFPRSTGIRDASLLMIKEKNGRFILVREPLHLGSCIISCDSECDESFEVQEYTTKEAYCFKLVYL
ncbi:uncharacterized protein LOC143238939 isoform X2 [Tachypleus tridentatus]|uniref:uncharacterized protein LOC143238939 isoform X2 n=1 Tax=Tachypleus tridentatus TaxID=6853 RepID=UPI003FD0B3BF